MVYDVIVMVGSGVLRDREWYMICVVIEFTVWIMCGVYRLCSVGD